MTVKTNYFKKEERLCSKKLLDELFKNGSSFLLYPFRVTWLISPDSQQAFPAQVVIAVPKKRFKHSVDRNLIKRRIREAYRLHKSTVFYPALQDNGKKILLALSYVGTKAHDFSFIEKKLKAVFAECLKKVEA
ncbi:ribonuclease P protein component [Pelobium manganitolerans]|uniref:ribonuclease P protein component n=1 Tax=Pelobium manganitolerans TaxID=1842495 RepID=UPI003FA3AC66